MILRKIKILSLLFLLPLLCFGQKVNNVFSLVENAAKSMSVQDINSAYNAILRGRNVYSIENSVRISDIAQSLKDKEIVIEFFDLPKSSGESNYLAFVLRHGMSAPRLYNICTDNVLSSLLDDNCDFYSDTKVLTTFTSPITEELKDASTVYYVPSGKLHEIALEYCLDANGKMFCENYKVYRLTSSGIITQKHNRCDYQNFSVWGGVDIDGELPYDDTDENMEPYRNRFPYLEDSYLAAEIITNDLRGKGKEVAFYHDDNADETNFKAMSGKEIDTFMIETHGIFTNGCSISPKNGEDAPLNNHALALYGAAHVMDGGIVPSGYEDGLVTEDEIAKLDLSNIDLAVISACKSGLGEVKWDGVHGLMRGFKQAGVNSLVMTLDDVIDYISGQLWIQFFRNLTDGQSKREALLNGIKYIRTMDNGFYSHPKYWTPFILIDGIE